MSLLEPRYERTRVYKARKGYSDINIRKCKPQGSFYKIAEYSGSETYDFIKAFNHIDSKNFTLTVIFMC